MADSVAQNGLHEWHAAENSRALREVKEVTRTEYDETVDYRRLYDEQLDMNAALEAEIAKLQSGKSESRGKALPLSNPAYEMLTSYQYRVKSLTFQLNAFRTGQKYLDMKANNIAQLAAKEREIARLKSDLSGAHAETVTVRNCWSQVFDDMEKAHAKELSKKDTEIRNLCNEVIELRKKLDEETAKRKSILGELYQVKTELEEEQGRNLKLAAQIKRDYENSSKPSSANPNRKKITNNREKTGKKPGGQPGHEHHPRQKHTPTEIIMIPAPDEYVNSPHYKPTGKIITKQMVDIHFNVIVTELSTPEFRDVRTGVRVHADFPAGMDLDVNYSGNVKALAFLLNNHCNVSIDKVSELISELTGGEVNISKGMINGLSKEFATRTEPDHKKAFADMLLAPAMNIDFTSARVNGKNVNVLVCANLLDALFFAREHKGIEGVKGSPAEDFQGALTHDHDTTYYNFGKWHQECLEHILRYLKNSMENEPGLTWNVQMRKLVQEMIHFWKTLNTSDGNDSDDGGNPDDVKNPDEINPDTVREFEERYDRILELAEKEYDYEPPSNYYKDGYNLFVRMRKYKENHLLFLHNKYVSPTNNLAERLLRLIKRKLHQMMTFRSFEGLHYFCMALGRIIKMKAEGNSLYERVSGVFAVPKP